MRKVLPICLSLLTLAPAAEARLDETVAQCDARYFVPEEPARAEPARDPRRDVFGATSNAFKTREPKSAAKPRPEPKPFVHNGLHSYKKNGFHIRCRFENDRCVFINFSKRNGGLAEDEIALLLEANKVGRTWQLQEEKGSGGARTWITTDGMYRATYEHNTLTLITAKSFNEAEAESKAKRLEDLKGF